MTSFRYIIVPLIVVGLFQEYLTASTYGFNELLQSQQANKEQLMQQMLFETHKGLDSAKETLKPSDTSSNKVNELKNEQQQQQSSNKTSNDESFESSEKQKQNGSQNQSSLYSFQKQLNDKTEPQTSEQKNQQQQSSSSGSSSSQQQQQQQNQDQNKAEEQKKRVFTTIKAEEIQRANEPTEASSLDELIKQLSEEKQKSQTATSTSKPQAKNATDVKLRFRTNDESSDCEKKKNFGGSFRSGDSEYSPPSKPAHHSKYPPKHEESYGYGPKYGQEYSHEQEEKYGYEPEEEYGPGYGPGPDKFYGGKGSGGYVEHYKQEPKEVSYHSKPSLGSGYYPPKEESYGHDYGYEKPNYKEEHYQPEHYEPEHYEPENYEQNHYESKNYEHQQYGGEYSAEESEHGYLPAYAPPPYGSHESYDHGYEGGDKYESYPGQYVEVINTEDFPQVNSFYHSDGYNDDGYYGYGDDEPFSWDNSPLLTSSCGCPYAGGEKVLKKRRHAPLLSIPEQFKLNLNTLNLEVPEFLKVKPLSELKETFKKLKTDKQNTEKIKKSVPPVLENLKIESPVTAKYENDDSPLPDKFFIAREVADLPRLDDNQLISKGGEALS